MISGFLGMADFLNRFGQHRQDGTPYFSNVRSGLIVALLSIGTLFGALIAAPIADWVGRKKSIIVSCAILCVGIIVQISSTDKWYQVMMGRFVAGLGVGALSLLVPMYQVRSFLSSQNQRLMSNRRKLLLDISEVHSSLHTSS